MSRLTKSLQCFTTVWLLTAVFGCGTTATQDSHPLLSNSASDAVARVYFLRSDPGFRGVMGNAFKISLANQELLTIAKGEYTLVYLKPYAGEVSVESSTVVNQGGINTQMKVKESQPFAFDESETYYIAFKETPRGYVPYTLSEDAARKLAIDLQPVGNAISEPL